MNGNELLEKMELIDPAYVEAADIEPEYRKKRPIRWGLLAACIALALAIAVPAMAATIPAFYEALYALSPATAQFFKPVQRACTDIGVRMEVVAAYVHDCTAEIYISMQDQANVGLDATTDLFDSCQIHTPFDTEGICTLSNFDPDTKTATFLIVIRQRDGQSITGDKITFSAQKLLFQKINTSGIIEGLDLGSAALCIDTRIVRPRGFGGTGSANASRKSEFTVLHTDGAIAAPADGVTLTGIGYVDGRLHIQVHYADILKTDNHGSIDLYNLKTGQRISSSASIAFFDDAKTGSYEDYIFDDIPEDALADYALYGDFTTAAPALEGNWSVTIPLENTQMR